jgi:2-iminobutanoate/2-iminopropanoate deaminase
MKEESSADKAPSAPNFLSQAITSNGLVFVSGQIHTLPDNTLVKGTTKEKVDQVFNNIRAILEAANATLDNIVKVVIYVTDMSEMPELNKVYPTYFNKPYPVREAVCVKALPLGAEIEISVIAGVGVLH